MLNNFTYNGMLSTDYQAYVFGGGTYHSPEKHTESVDVAGRNGAVLFDYGNWRNLTVDYQIIIMKNFTKNFLQMKADMMSISQGKYYELRDTFHPDYYRMAVLKRISAPKMSNDYDAGVFTITFECKPQLFFADESEILIEDEAEIINNTGYIAYPLITITGDGSFQVGNNVVTVAEHTGKIIYDTEIQEAYGTAGENMNQYISLADGVPVLNAGITGITVDGLTLEILPRRYRI